MFSSDALIWLGTRDQAREAISHIKRILRVKSALFQVETSSRRPFPGGEHANLSTVVEWAFSESGQLERYYAKTCFEFFEEFVMALPGKIAVMVILLISLSLIY